MNYFNLFCTAAAICIASSLAAMPATAGEGQARIKFAILAPEGSSWMKALRALDEELQGKTGKTAALKFYPGGVSGDEKDVIRKIRIGQLHGGGFTGVGLGEILPEIRILDLPFLFRNDREIESTYAIMTGYFTARFAEKGFVLLGWTPVGRVYFFSKYPVRTLDDLAKTKAWMWEGDPLVQEAYAAVNVTPYPLSITDVLMSLQTGMIDTIYAPPLGALALQWSTKVKYMASLPMGYGVGAALLSKKEFDSLTPQNQAVLREVSRKHLEQLMRALKKENEDAAQVILKSGVTATPLPEAGDLKKFHDAGEAIKKKLAGKLYPPELLEKITRHLAQLRQSADGAGLQP